MRPLLAVSAVSSALVLGAALRGGPLLMRDAVSTPRSYLTDAALGLGDAPARAVPQDGLLAMASAAVPGTLVLIAMTWISLALGGLGAGVLVSRLVPGWAPPCAAGLVAVWNPWVAERLMQGQWSLIAGYAAIPWVLVAAQRIWSDERGGWPLLWAAVVGAGLTPTGSLLAAIVVVAAVIVPLAWRKDLRRSAAAIIPVVVGALPWLVATVLNQSPTTGDPGGAEAFALRAEPGLGRVLTALGMGGIWNADAVPGSRTTWWGAVATVLLLAVVGAGWWSVGGRVLREERVGRIETARGDLPTSSARVLLVVAAVLALLTTALAVFASTTPGLAVMSALLEHVPGAGLLRDTQKFLALLLPAVAIGVAGAVGALTRLVPVGFAFAAVALLTVGPLPDAALRLHPVDLPSDWQAVAQMIPDDQGAVALWPTGMTRDYSFAPTQSLDPARRLLRAPVLEDGELEVDGKPVDADPSTRGAQVRLALEEGAGPKELASHGVGWVLVEEPERNGRPSGFDSATPVFRGDYLTLYRVENPVIVPGASPVHRATMIVLHLVWLAVLVLACLLAGSRYVPTTRRRRD
ncbi:MAG TPA: hypothetical protein PK331_00360 [Gordonia sp. (in: high G+C Gram-positive bacteria)]|uniref:hypothetical protein n=1 Tax=unclassified Gordonia (in: high G+C Gram-positive bacteria) TaxID=2657482 RepID=UPI0025BCD608|nr:MULTISPECIES: hypothetical protein [unclassified Gordonia (in: high G+C Gram-positive bacteria)]HNP57101.1 hypothetical protein [Gordonia sp. (in: high G+C Gram-positive bacteria)]HRC49362.1 hypothetical protein [Gordonia sp. (in: high G+C Gram-positive bacteria)]